MTANLSPRARLAVYVVTGVVSAVVAYLVSKDIIGDAEVTLWAAIAALVNGLAALNTPTAELSAGRRRKMAVEQAERNQRGHVDLAVVLLVGILVLLVLIVAGVL